MEENFPPDEEYDRQCGDIFLTVKGELLIHCTLCETRYKGFQRYAEHVKVHCDDAQYKGVDEFLVLSDKRNDSLRDYHDLEDDIKIEMEFFTASEQNEETSKISLEPDEFQIKSDISDDFIWKTEENENLLSNMEDEPVIKPLKYRFNASRKPKDTYQTAKKQYNCSLCDYSCNYGSNLISHMNRHSAYKPHQCESCSKAFYTRSELQTHIRSHTGERPYLCSLCGQGFTTSSKLSLHTKRHTKIRDKECTFCDMKFYTYSALRVHIAVHNKERPVTCSICQATFKLEKALKIHMKTHENKREHKCDLCTASFNQKCNLNTHKKTVHGVGIFKEVFELVDTQASIKTDSLDIF